MRALYHRLTASLARFRDDRRGSIIILAALLFPIVIGGLGLWIETGYWYHMQRRVQHIADVSAHAAGVRIRAGDTKAVIQFASISRDSEIYKLAANYLQQMNWRESVDILKAIIMFYTKAKAFVQLAAFYDSCGQVSGLFY